MANPHSEKMESFSRQSIGQNSHQQNQKQQSTSTQVSSLEHHRRKTSNPISKTTATSNPISKTAALIQTKPKNSQPTQSPSAHPTITTKPSSPPTFSPTLTLQVSPVIKNIVMMFDNCQHLGNSSLQVWLDITARFVTTSMSINLKATGIDFSDLEVDICSPRQRIPLSSNDNSSSTAVPTGNKRVLQQSELSPLDILFDAVIKLRSPDHAPNFASYFITTLDTKPKLDAYLTDLSSFGDVAFGAINNVTVKIGGKSIARPDPLILQAQPVPLMNAALTASATAVASFFLLVAIATFRCLTLRKKNASKELTKDNKSQAKVADEMYIEFSHPHDDVSTLGGIWTQTSQRFDDPTVGPKFIICGTDFQNYLNGESNCDINANSPCGDMVDFKADASDNPSKNIQCYSTHQVKADGSDLIPPKHSPSTSTLCEHIIIVIKNAAAVHPLLLTRFYTPAESPPAPEVSVEPTFNPASLKYSDQYCHDESSVSKVNENTLLDKNLALI